MAATATSQVIQNSYENGVNNERNGVSREEIKAAISKTLELRALHAALVHGNTSAYPRSTPVSLLSARDYPIFTPSYEDEHLSGFPQIPSSNPILSKTWEPYGKGARSDNETLGKGYKKPSSIGSPSGLESIESPCLADDQKSAGDSCTNHTTSLQTPSGTDYFDPVSSCNKCKPATITYESDTSTTNTIVPLASFHTSVPSQPRSKGMIFSWLPQLKKKHKHENPTTRTESGQYSQRYSGGLSFETLKKELMQANENKEAALIEVAEMKFLLGDLKKKLEGLENYCNELKKELRQSKTTQIPERILSFSRKGKSVDGIGENLMPVREEVMAEGFVQIVSETRLSVKNFSKALVDHTEETDSTLRNNLNALLQPYEMSLDSKNPKLVLYHLEAIINQALYQDFENCIFQRNGSPKFLDPQQNRQARFSSFLALRNLSWNEVLRKGTKYYSEEFSTFCDQKMSCIVARMDWTRPWPEQLLQAFFVAAKCVWLQHLMAFSFDPPLGILRVEENRIFDPHYMEDKTMEEQESYGSSKVKIMVTPGFYVGDRVQRCSVLCSYKSIA